MRESVTAAAIICFCCCCCCCAKPTESPVIGSAVAVISEKYYSGLSVTEFGEPVADLVKQAFKDFDFSRIGHLSERNRTKVLADIYQQFYVSRALNQKFALKMRSLIRQSIGIDNSDIDTNERDLLAARIPKEIFDRVERWNTATQAGKETQTQEIVVIGQADASSGLWSFGLDSKVLTARVLEVSLGVHLTAECRHRLRGRRLRARVMTSRDSRAAGVSDEIDADRKSEIFVNVTVEGVKEVNRIRQSQLDARILFEIVDDSTNESVQATFVVMDTKVTFASPFAHSVRRRRSLWPFPNATLAKEEEEEAKEEEEAAKTTESPIEKRETLDCTREQLRSRYGRKSCCVMRAPYDLKNQPEVISPRQISISYCTGECLSDSRIDTPHSLLMQTLVNGRNRLLPHDTNQDLKLCCVPRTYRSFKLLVARRLPGGKHSVEIREIRDISAESCTCA